MNLVEFLQKSFFAIEYWSPEKPNKKLTSSFIHKQTRLSSKAAIPPRQPSSHLNKVYLRKTIWIEWPGNWFWHVERDSFKLQKNISLNFSLQMYVNMSISQSVKSSEIKTTSFCQTETNWWKNYLICFLSLHFGNPKRTEASVVIYKFRFSDYYNSLHSLHFQKLVISVRFFTCKNKLVEILLECFFLPWKLESRDVKQM